MGELRSVAKTWLARHVAEGCHGCDLADRTRAAIAGTDKPILESVSGSRYIAVLCHAAHLDPDWMALEEGAFAFVFQLSDAQFGEIVETGELLEDMPQAIASVAIEDGRPALSYKPVGMLASLEVDIGHD